MREQIGNAIRLEALSNGADLPAGVEFAIAEALIKRYWIREGRSA